MSQIGTLTLAKMLEHLESSITRLTRTFRMTPRCDKSNKPSRNDNLSPFTVTSVSNPTDAFGFFFWQVPAIIGGKK